MGRENLEIVTISHTPFSFIMLITLVRGYLQTNLFCSTQSLVTLFKVTL